MSSSPPTLQAERGHNGASILGRLGLDGGSELSLEVANPLLEGGILGLLGLEGGLEGGIELVALGDLRLALRQGLSKSVSIVCLMIELVEKSLPILLLLSDPAVCCVQLSPKTTPTTVASSTLITCATSSAATSSSATTIHATIVLVCRSMTLLDDIRSGMLHGI